MDQSELWYSFTGNLLIAALGKNPLPFEQLSAVTSQMLLAAAKILDDIQDNAITRSRKPTLHEHSGLATALLAGTTALFLPMRLLVDYPAINDSQRLELYQIFHRCCLRAQMGQAQDLHWSGQLTESFLTSPDIEETILQGYKGKDSFFTEAAMEGAAVIAGADPATRAACLSFGTALGLALGIRNDVADFSPANLQAGDAGMDVLSGKASFVLARAVALLKGGSKKRLLALACRPTGSHDNRSLNEVISVVVESGALESSLKTARQMMQAAWKEFSVHLPPSEAKTMLRVLWTIPLAPLRPNAGTPLITPSTKE
jgi:geranylgeranyl pyrophosphate synthase